MKNRNIILSAMVVSVTILSYSAKAQVNKPLQDSAQNNNHQYHSDVHNENGDQNKMHDNQMQHPKTDHVMMQNGKMMVMKDGKMMPMEKDMTLKNGTKYRADGSYVTKDGKRTMLKEGEMMDMNGNKMMVMKKEDKTKKEY